MTEAVLDASVVLKWFRSEGERHADAARAVRARYEAGQVVLFAPSLLFLEILNVAGRRWRLPVQRLDEVAASLPRLGLELVEPDLRLIARWTARGLTAYDAAYVAVAAQTGAPLITDDDEIVRTAPTHAVRLAAAD